MFRPFLISIFAALQISSVYALDYDTKHRGNDNNYDYLYQKWKVITTVCLTGDVCREEEIKVDALSFIECQHLKTRFVTQWVIDNGLDRWVEIGDCVRSDNHKV